jgi:hypothetical protein
MIIFTLFCNVLKSQCTDALCIMLFYHHECHDTYVFYKQRWIFLKNYMNKKLLFKKFYDYYKIIIDKKY